MSTDEGVDSAGQHGDGAARPETQPEATKQPRGERAVMSAFAVAIVAALGLTVVYSLGRYPQLEGILLGLSLGGIGVGTVIWAQRFMPSEEVAEERGQLASTEEEVAAFTAAFEEGEEPLHRRRLLVRLATGAVAALGLAALFPIRSLGPRPGRGLKVTPYEPGLRLVTESGTPVRPADLAPGTVVTVWPEGHIDAADAPTLLIGTGVERLRLAEPTVDGVVAYSKLCTHTGCPVGLYQQREQLLLCPCHQSTFAVLEGAVPVFGPATRPLPQLPIGLDDEGFFVALGDYPEPVGGVFWDRDV